MSLTDIVSGLDLTWAPRIALVLFGVVFIILIARLWRRGHRLAHGYTASLPLQDDVSAFNASQGSTNHGQS